MCEGKCCVDPSRLRMLGFNGVKLDISYRVNYSNLEFISLCYFTDKKGRLRMLKAFKHAIKLAKEKDLF